ncbi:hypothetical protein HYPSUDRAFT_304560 [Hypholoma sublateritium FD-334 SS-4]|uniref:C2H2-type domain-containing protein n=1 Tax=Hypholoma sublateritium (strain FD-334 SS-4) TaxID=945553 RepID=A0A0D2P5L9_HYPSF|nr:hypothetical protein HYPSUDRAFT_304560 [Hypholoma sublateritium FD-334 SS-4]
MAANGSSPVTIIGNEFTHSMASPLPSLSSIFQAGGDLQPNMPWASSEQLPRDPDDDCNMIAPRQDIQFFHRPSQSGGLPTTAHLPRYSENLTSSSQLLRGQLYTINDWSIQHRASTLDDLQWSNDADMEGVGQTELNRGTYSCESPLSSQDSKNYMWQGNSFDDPPSTMDIDQKFSGPLNGKSPSPRAPSSRYTQCKEVVGTDAIRNAGKERRKCPPKFVCPYNDQCKSEFTRRHNLTNHIRTHLGKAGANCEKCGKELAQSSRGRHEKKCNPRVNYRTIS